MYKLALLCAAAACGLVAAYVDFHNDEPQPALLVILTSSFVLGMLSRRFAWLYAGSVAFVFALAHWIGPELSIQPLFPMKGGPWWTLMILAIPAAIASYAGVGFRRIVVP